MRLLCIIPTMGPGGAERAMSHLLSYFARECSVTLLTFENRNAVSFYSVAESIEYLKGDKLGGRGIRRALQILSRPSLIRRTVGARAPDVIVSFTDTTNITALIACAGLRVPIIISERVDPSHHDIGWIRSRLRNRIYPLADMLVVPSRRVAEFFPTLLQSKIRVIGNPVPLPAVTARPDAPATHGRKRLISVGRYEPQKGFDRLIGAFSQIAQSHPDWDLHIFGEGPQRFALEEQAHKAGLSDRIKLIGLVANVFEQLTTSHVMAFPSLYEGFPNALAEGLSVGLPAVGFKDVSGVEELILHEQTGLLVDPTAGTPGLASALSRLLGDSALRAKLGARARSHVKAWAPDHIFALWNDVILEAVSSRAKSDGRY
jgi:GalNAc-alpha-(1->4)-GalNAc-alpha-(1->3)-diNAcBac-PP-undecaprenol alpha-1,4-N-acetyl-D-galactosaminyltransferase